MPLMLKHIFNAREQISYLKETHHDERVICINNMVKYGEVKHIVISQVAPEFTMIQVSTISISITNFYITDLTLWDPPRV